MKNQTPSYGRGGKPMPMQQPQQQMEAGAEGAAAENNGSEPIRVNGFQQILEMLRAADPQFRDSLLRRLAARDIQLYRALMNDLQL